MKETAYTIDGQEIAFMAPSIKKDFYFPEDARTTEKWNAVQSHVDECSKSVEYFKAENLKPCNCRAARLLDALQDSRYELYTVAGKDFVDVERKYEFDYQSDWHCSKTPGPQPMPRRGLITSQIGTASQNTALPKMSTVRWTPRRGQLDFAKSLLLEALLFSDTHCDPDPPPSIPSILQTVFDQS